MRSILVGIAACALLSGCGNLPSTSTAVNATISQAQIDVQSAINDYGIAKGLAQVASIAVPGLAPVVAGITTVIDPMVAQAQTALTNAATDAAALEALAAQIKAQASTLTQTAAPAIKAVPSVAPLAWALDGLRQG